MPLGASWSPRPIGLTTRRPIPVAAIVVPLRWLSSPDPFLKLKSRRTIVVYVSGVLIYPRQSQVTILGTENSVTEYRLGRKFSGHRFCRTCGVPVYMKLYGPPQAFVDSLPPEKQRIVQSKREIVPVSLHSGQCGMVGLQGPKDG
ncbi:hypothetical protein VTN77DRAFT_3202 [Rasamsonia byssochlamydoides]|uniref:uncharacterized protein n=1 Tax=Rasamsonia byssochlamydoides TaxID=89139 RepID=UPI00374456FB